MSETSIGVQRIARTKRLMNSNNGNARYSIAFIDRIGMTNTKPDSSYVIDIENWIASGGEREVWLDGNGWIVRVAEVNKNEEPLTAPISAKRARGHFSGN